MKLLGLIFLFAAVVLSQACRQQPSNNEAAEKAADSISNAKAEKSCYAYIANRDTILMQIFLEGKEVSGSLEYNYYEKDRNIGNIHGEFKGDLLLAEYTFTSEGTTSSREVAFIKRGETFTEGYGDVEEKNGIMAFKDPHKLVFDDKMVLTKVECR